jgi:hypothetical protein
MARRTSTSSISRAVTIEAWLVVAVMALTVWLFQNGYLAELVQKVSEFGPVPASLLAGAAYSTFVTTPLAVGGFITLGELPAVPIWQMALAGALGATIVDLALVKGVRSPLALLVVRAVIGRDSNALKRRVKRWPVLRWVTAITGGILVAVPLPTDELGVVFFSASGLRMIQMIPLIFVADFVGVYSIVSASRLFL